MKEVTKEWEKFIHKHHPSAKVYVEESSIIKGKFYEVAEIPGGKRALVQYGDLKNADKGFRNMVLEAIVRK